MGIFMATVARSMPQFGLLMLPLMLLGLTAQEAVRDSSNPVIAARLRTIRIAQVGRFFARPIIRPCQPGIMSSVIRFQQACYANIGSDGTGVA
jgi:hypothetical protein